MPTSSCLCDCWEVRCNFCSSIDNMFAFCSFGFGSYPFYVVWATWICSLVSDINLWEILNHYCFKYFFSSLLLLVFPLHIYYSFNSCPLVLTCNIPFFFLAFQFWKFLLINPQTKSSLLTTPSKTFFTSVTEFLISWICCLHHPSVLACCLLFSLQPLAY